MMVRALWPLHAPYLLCNYMMYGLCDCLRYEKLWMMLTVDCLCYEKMVDLLVLCHEKCVGFYVLKLIVCKQKHILFSIKLLLSFIQ